MIFLLHFGHCVQTSKMGRKCRNHGHCTYWQHVIIVFCFRVVKSFACGFIRFLARNLAGVSSSSRVEPTRIPGPVWGQEARRICCLPRHLRFVQVCILLPRHNLYMHGVPCKQYLGGSFLCPHTGVGKCVACLVACYHHERWRGIFNPYLVVRLE